MKAVFVYRFTSFVRWPETAFATLDAPLVGGVLGPDPFDGQLDAAVINLRAAQSAGLSVGGQLPRMAEIVHGR